MGDGRRCDIFFGGAGWFAIFHEYEQCPETTIIRDIKPKTHSLCPLFSRVFHVNFTCFSIPLLIYPPLT